MSQMALGAVLIGLSIGCYGFAWWKGIASLRGLGFGAKISALMSHLPDDTSKAWPHVWGGVLGFGGVSLAASAVLDHFYHFGHHLTVEVAGFLFAVLIATTAFWTLWQTKRIEQNQAVEMFGFRKFIEALTFELELLRAEVYSHPKAGFDHWRILLITTNPFLGQLSFPKERVTDDFQTAMQRAARCVELGLRFEILCGDSVALETFHEQHFAKSALTDKLGASTKATAEAEKFVGDIREAGASIHQVRRVPSVQFAVIGNVVFEFILDTSTGVTEIHRYKRTRETVVAKRFAEFFGELVQGISPVIPQATTTVAGSNASGSPGATATVSATP